MLEDLSSNPKHLHKSQGMAEHGYNPTIRGKDTFNSRAFWAARLAKMVRFQFPGTILSQGSKLVSNTGKPLRFPALYMYTHRHIPPHMCIHRTLTLYTKHTHMFSGGKMDL